MFRTVVLVLIVLAGIQADDEQFPGDENPWLEPTTEDVRSPCPFINTLANHGFINRSGKGVDVFAMVAELSEKFDVAPTLFLRLVEISMGFNMTYTDMDGVVVMDIDSLFEHNKLEHDASLVRADEYFGFNESKLVDLTLLDGLLQKNPNSTVLTKADIMEYQTERILDSRVNNPEHFFVEGQTTSFSAQATLFLLFGQHPMLESVDKASLKEFLEFERFPEGYAPRTSDPDFVPLDVILNGTQEYDIRLEFAENFQEVISRNITEDDVDDDTSGSFKVFNTFAALFVSWLIAVLL